MKSKCIVVIALFFLACKADRNQDEEKETVYQLNRSEDVNESPIKVLGSSTYDFGTIGSDAKIKHTFSIRNMGTEPLIITNAITTCGCTVARYPKKPVLTNRTDSVIVEFDASEGDKGFQNKVVTLTSNYSGPPTLLIIKGQVK